LDKSDKHQIFYGYIVIAAAFLILTTAWGSNRSFAVFLQPMIEETGWSRAGLSGAFTLAMIVMGFAGIFSGKGTDRFGPRVITIGCGFFLLLGYTLCAMVRVKWQLYLFYGVITGLGLSVTVPLVSLVARWFVKKRALVTGILIAGPGLGNMLMPLLFSMFIRAHGWRSAYLLLGGITFVFIFGFSLWSSGGLIGPIAADLFGLRAHGAIYGSIFLSGSIGGAFGAVIIGYVYDMMGNYDVGFLLCIFINALSIVSLSFLKPIPETGRGSEPSAV
jgi:MFS family permease